MIPRVAKDEEKSLNFSHRRTTTAGKCLSKKNKTRPNFSCRLLNMPNFVVFVMLIALVSIFGDSALRGSHKHGNLLIPNPDSLEILLHEQDIVTYTYTNLSTFTFTIHLNTSTGLSVEPALLQFSPLTLTNNVNVTGVSVTSRAYIDVQSCLLEDTKEPCPFSLTNVFVMVTVSYSRLLSILIMITGWIYFFAWSLSFYPQILLNYRRKSVEGFNFDFLVLNIIGFFCYSVYNCLMFWDPEIQDLYIDKDPRAQIPVLLNDVVFSLHAIFACIIIGLQCCLYERGNQRVSHICMGWSAVLVLLSAGSLIATLFRVLDWLRFITFLSYVKMAVTLSKYFPQAILNFRRKSTVGWSIGNVLLDFTGGLMDVMQMVLQGSNTNDWSAFYGNPVKFGLGLVSTVFDVVFLLQHYVLYRHSEGYEVRHEANESLQTVVHEEEPNENVTGIDNEVYH